MATPLSGRTHTTLSVKVDEDLSAATTNNVEPTLLGVNGASAEDSNSSCVSDDEVGPVDFPVLQLQLYTQRKQLGFSMANHCIPDDCMYSINTNNELMYVKHQQFELSPSYFNRHDIDCMIDFCVLHSVIFLLYILFLFFNYYYYFLLFVLMYNIIIIIRTSLSKVIWVQGRVAAGCPGRGRCSTAPWCALMNICLLYTSPSPRD